MYEKERKMFSTIFARRFASLAIKRTASKNHPSRRVDKLHVAKGGQLEPGGKCLVGKSARADEGN
ncbi:MAG: hypothetical protein WAV11_01625 [Minisyncoccia bacterium]